MLNLKKQECCCF